jgi:dipeptidyl aminopeptidase/acylaminoacyl peptidase
MSAFRWLSAAAIAILVLPGPSLIGREASTSPRPVAIADLFAIRDLHDPQISPDGQWVAYSVGIANLDEDKFEERICMTPAAGGDAIPLTTEGVSSSHPRWSPDGKYLAFLSARNQGKTQVWLLDRQGGEAQKLTDTPQDVEDFAWASESKRLVLALRDPKPEELEAVKSKTKDQDDDKAKDKKAKTPKPWVVDRLQFKRDTVGYLDRRRTHLYIFDVAAKSLVQVTSGDFDDNEPAWSPDGTRIAFTSNRSLPDPDRTYDSNIWVVAADNHDKGAHLTQITANPGEDHDAVWSPDGKWIAHSSTVDPKLFEYATKHIAISPVPSSDGKPGEAKLLTLALDRMATQPHFTPDGKSIYFIADDDGTQNLCLVEIATGRITRPIGGRVMVYDYSLSRSGEIAAQISTLDRPNEIFTLPAGRLTRITHANDEQLAKLKLAQAEYVHFRSKDGAAVAGYMYKPLDYVPGKKYPTILRPHGGPVWAYYSEISHLPQLLAANGYVVLLPNPRGSSGYGQDYCKAIWADWGDKDFQDDMAMVDYAIAEGIADSDKLGVGGWSYGGISTDFIIGQTQRFRAAISGAGAAEFTSLYGHDQYQKDYLTELGYPWEHPEVWNKIAPFYRVTNITTPSLFMGGNIDWNVPILGGEQMYQALKALGRDTQLVVYPGEYHEFTIPSHMEDRLKRYLAWYGHYVKGDASPAALPQDTSEPRIKAGDK